MHEELSNKSVLEGLLWRHTRTSLNLSLAGLYYE